MISSAKNPGSKTRSNRRISPSATTGRSSLLSPSRPQSILRLGPAIVGPRHRLHDRRLVHLAGRTRSPSARSRSTAIRWLVRRTSSSSDEMKTHDVPSSASSRTSRWTSAFAPMSIPRVGSSRMRTCGCVASQRARMTFCWLPPLRFLTSWSAVGVAIFRIRMYSSAIAVCCALLRCFSQPRPACTARMMFSRTVRSSTIPSALRSSGHRAMPRPIDPIGEWCVTGTPSIVSVPPSGRSIPNSSAAISVRPEPSRPANPTTSPARSSRSNGSIEPARPRPLADQADSPPPRRFPRA